MRQRAVLLLTALMTLALSGCNIQNSLLYFPSLRPPTEGALREAKLKPWPTGSLAEYRGLTPLLAPAPAKGTVLVFHGNAGTAIDRTFYADMLAPLGYRVILAEYPKYGGRNGALGEKTFVADAIESVRLAHDQSGPPLFLVGESLGCGVVAATVNQTPLPIAGVVLITPWDTLASVARSKFPLLPIGFLLTDNYDSIANLASYAGRIMVVGAGHDDIIPIGHAERLFRTLTTPGKRMIRITQAGHNDILFHTDRQWWQEVMNFITQDG